MKNSKRVSGLIHTALISIFTMALSPAFADDAPSTDKSLMAGTSCGNDTDCLVDGYGVSLRALLFQPAYRQAQVTAGGSILNFILSPRYQGEVTAVESKTSQSVVTLVSNTGNVADQLLATTPEFFANGIVLTPANILAATVSNTAAAISPVPFVSPGNTTPVSPLDIQGAINTMSFESVIAPMTYKKSPDNAPAPMQFNQPLIADTFIKYATGLANPMRPADFTATKLPADGRYFSVQNYLVDLQKKTEVRDYLTALRNYTAQLSVGISNFYYLYRERMPIVDPDTQAKAIAMMNRASDSSSQPAPSGPVSPLEVQQYIATSRVSDSNWYQAMQNAAPATLLRETLFLLAEIPPMLFQLHLDLERILATMSAIQIQQANGSRLLLEQQRNAVDKILTNPEQASSEAKQAAEEAAKHIDKADIEAAKKAAKDVDTSNIDTSAGGQ